MNTGLSHSLILRPSDYAPLLIEHFRQGADVKYILPRRRLCLQVGGQCFCYLIMKGSGTVHRRIDDRMISTFSGPALVGLGNLNRMEMDAYIKTQTPSEIAVLRMSVVHDIINSAQLWEPVAKHMMVIAGKLFHSGAQLSAPSTYDIVRTQLNELFNESPEVRENTTAERYIRDKTQLSRSGIMRILAALKEGGYIEVRRGILININKLPSNF
ncbi:helix-turn-helix domain-containing protein (plasmid) [Enterobacter sp. JS8-1]|uniref:winged helix-turn-helix transcriptional regulator n=1 Tax=Enterobacter sp. JS8-1 TaxID=3411633 RepID=UPI003BA346D1